MAETHSRPQSADNAQETPAKGRSRAETIAEEAISAERRSFAEAGQAAGQTIGRVAGDARDAAEAGLKAGKDLAAAGSEAARKASGQAVDLWRASLDPLAHMQNEFSRWFEQTWRQSVAGRLPGESLLAAFSGAPMADVYETDGAVELCIELPGLTAQEVNLSLRGETLTLSGERNETAEREDGAYRVRERRFGRFERTFPLPAGADRSRIEARFDKGVLKVTIPLAAQSQATAERIAIKG